jgi:hypothetical protein
MADRLESASPALNLSGEEAKNKAKNPFTTVSQRQFPPPDYILRTLSGASKGASFVLAFNRRSPRVRRPRATVCESCRVRAERHYCSVAYSR